MSNYTLYSTTSATTSQISPYESHVAYDQELQYMDTPQNDYWCEFCTLPYNDCICYTASPISPQENYSGDGYDTQNITNYAYQQASYPSIYSTSNPSTSSYYATSSSSSKPQSSYSAIAPAQTPACGTAANSKLTENSSKRGKRKGSMAPAEAREKRLEQNRRSQRSFRDRQARLVVDLKQKVEILTEENEKLVNELSALGLRDPSRDSRSPGTEYSLS